MSHSAPVALPHCSSTTICCRTSNPRPPSRSAWLIALNPASSTACFAIGELSAREPVALLALGLERDQHPFGEVSARSLDSRSSGVRRMSIGRASLADAHARHRWGHASAGRWYRIARVSLSSRRLSTRQPAGSRRHGIDGRQASEPEMRRPRRAPISRRCSGSRPRAWPRAPSPGASPPPRYPDHRSRRGRRARHQPGDRGLGPRLAVDPLDRRHRPHLAGHERLDRMQRPADSVGLRLQASPSNQRINGWKC